MSTNKTVANDSSVSDFLDSLEDKQQAEDSRTLITIMQMVSGELPSMWGNAIIGFGSVRLKYESGRELDWLVIGFSPRKGKISLYVTFDAAKLTSQFPNLGKYKIGKGCIYISKLADVDMQSLTKLIETAYKTGYQQPKREDGKEQGTVIEPA